MSEYIDVRVGEACGEAAYTAGEQDVHGVRVNLPICTVPVMPPDSVSALQSLQSCVYCQRKRRLS